jgi:hypothetical protein
MLKQPTSALSASLMPPLGSQYKKMSKNNSSKQTKKNMENKSFSTNERFTVAPVLQVIDDSGLTCSVSSSNETVNEIPNQLWQSTSSTHSGVPIYRRNAEPKLKVGRIRDTEYHEQKLKRLQQGTGKRRSHPWFPKSRDRYSFIYHHLQPNIYNILERPVFNRHTISTYYHIYT